MATVASLIKYLSEFPADAEVQIAGSRTDQNQTINSLVSKGDTEGNLLAPIVLSAHYYGATNGE